VKASDWTGICYREHERGGEVIAVTLTAPSMVEMVGDILSASSATRVYDKDGNPAEREHVVAGARLGSLRNEAAGGREVDFSPLADADTVTVRGADGSVRTVAFAAA